MDLMRRRAMMAQAEKSNRWEEWVEASFYLESGAKQNIFNNRNAGMILEANLDGNPFTFSGTGYKSATLTAGRHELKLRCDDTQQINRLFLGIANIIRVKFPPQIDKTLYRALEVDYKITEGVYYLAQPTAYSYFYGTGSSNTYGVFRSTLYVKAEYYNDAVQNNQMKLFDNIETI